MTVRLSFAPGDAAQVDFGAGPMLRHPDGDERRTWAFVMTLAHSRHQYVEFVWDQTVATWLGCHRRAFEWFGAVPARVIVDNAKCAITKACNHDPLVQRAYAECEPPRVPWRLVELSHAHLPGIRWNLRNLAQLQRTDAKKFAEQAERLMALLAHKD